MSDTTGDEMNEGETFESWEDDHTSLVHVLWAASWDGLTLKDDFDEIASQIMQSRWMRATKAVARTAALKEAADLMIGEAQP